MAFNGSGTFLINSSGQPVATSTVISSTVFNALTADLATGLSTCITKDGQTATTARIPFAAGINSTLTTDASSIATGSIITAGGIGCAKAIWGGTTMNIAGAVTFQSTLTVSGVFTAPAAYKSASMTGGDATITVEQDLTSATVSLDRNGTWLVFGVFDIGIDATSGTGATVSGILHLNGVQQTGFANFIVSGAGDNQRASIGQVWPVSVSSQPKTAKLRAVQSSGSSTVTAYQDSTKIAAIFLGT